MSVVDPSNREALAERRAELHRRVEQCDLEFARNRTRLDELESEGAERRRERDARVSSEASRD